MQGLRVAVVGATGLVGRQLIDRMAERSFPIRDLRLLAGARSAGTTIPYAGEQLQVGRAEEAALDGMDIVFMAVESDISRELAPAAVRKGAVVIDKSSAFRMDAGVPLVVPEVNPQTLDDHQGILASPNCSTIQLVMALHPLHQAAGLRRVIVSTYQAVSGSGAAAVDTLHRQAAQSLEGEESDYGPYPGPIAFNVLPQCDAFGADGYTKEEWKITEETRKIMSLPQLPVTATAVRVPVFVGHAESVWVELERSLTVNEIQMVLSEAPGVTVIDRRLDAGYPTPVQAAGQDDVMVGRIRQDLGTENGYWLWVVADNLRKGAATNAVQIAEALLARGLAA